MFDIPGQLKICSFSLAFPSFIVFVLPISRSRCRSISIEVYPNKAMFAHGIRAHVIGSDGVKRRHVIDEHRYFKGSVAGDESSVVYLYMSADIVSARIHTRGDVYVVEPARYHFENTSDVDMFAYRASEVAHTGEHALSATFCGVDSNGRTLMTLDHSPDQQQAINSSDWSALNIIPSVFQSSTSTRKPKSRRNPASSSFNTCLVTVVSDSSFFTRYQKESEVTRIMVGLGPFSVCLQNSIVLISFYKAPVCICASRSL
jgi:hypothetical protein